jgi:hypothetical protein
MKNKYTIILFFTLVNALLNAQERFETHASVRTIVPPNLGGSAGISIPVTKTSALALEGGWMTDLSEYSEDKYETVATLDLLYRWSPWHTADWKRQWFVGAGFSHMSNRYYRREFIFYCPTCPPQGFLNPAYSYKDWYFGSSLHNTIRINRSKHLAIDCRHIINIYPNTGYGFSDSFVVPFMAFEVGAVWKW